MKYTNKTDFIAKLRKGAIAGVILWQGASAIDGAPIVLVATKFAGNSGNVKTGAQVQSFILPDPRASGIECSGSRPAKIVAWLKKTAAQSICGDCPHAWQWDESAGEYKKGACYVKEYQSPAAVLGAVYRGSYPIAGVDFPVAWIGDFGRNLDIRCGSYGDPAACDPAIWAMFTAFAKTSTGYTHGWKSAFPQFKRNAFRLREFCMASCDSAADYRAAIDAGYRAFYVVPKGATDNGRSVLSVGVHVEGAMICPASKEFEQATGKRTDCASCGACSGAGGKGERMPNVFIVDHGQVGIDAPASCPAATRILERMGA
jgi:hypothetical protein